MSESILITWYCGKRRLQDSMLRVEQEAALRDGGNVLDQTWSDSDSPTHNLSTGIHRAVAGPAEMAPHKDLRVDPSTHVKCQVHRSTGWGGGWTELGL